ncbi:helix-turn-helix domain-containing protein [Epilithonimonas arachidiradicis]|uniref:AraC-like DNA-binding protein n=2 Tax=Epilithonimonas arachidiradicis TaxID=1617282 RepID=A0A420DBG0_9FLAO|nr:AraC family transcriptional regulator [Epilithonimonas arachidiradicis]RKE88918.1 AraC-like DNA-binding protein [Epilithonimonas arachidiradicis]
MFRVFFLWLMVVSGVILTSAQSNPETLKLLDKAYQSLYENPDNAFQILQNIDVNKEPELIKQRVQIILSRAYNFKGDYAKSIDQSIDNLNKNRNENNSFYSDFALAQQYQSLRLYKQSIRISQNLVDKASKIKSQHYPENLSAYIYQLNASNLMVQKKWKEAEENLNQSNSQLKNTDEDFIISIENQIYQTFIYISQNQIDKAEKLVNEIQKKLEKTPQYVFLRAFNLDNFGRINFLKKDYVKSTENLNQALELIQNKAYDALRYRIYEDLSKNYLALKNEDLYQKYYSIYKEQTDKLDKNKKDAIRNLVKLNEQYEAKRIENADRNFINNILIIAIVCFVGILAIVLMNLFEKRKAKSIQKQIDFYSKQQDFIKKIDESKTVIEPKSEKIEPDISKKTPLISKEKEMDILARLEEFEKSEMFLNRDMSLAMLAGQLDTNTKYLSDVINRYKEKNYNNYINELRINYIAYLLKTDSAYLNYKVSYLAEKAGFSSHSAFTTVFKSVTGISPNTYIQQLTQNKQ